MKAFLFSLFFSYPSIIFSQIQWKFTESKIDRTSVLTAYKFSDDATKLHFAVITKLSDFQAKSFEMQAHRWFGNVSILVSRVYDYKLGPMNYISFWIRRPKKSTRLWIIP